MGTKPRCRIDDTVARRSEVQPHEDRCSASARTPIPALQRGFRGAPLGRRIWLYTPAAAPRTPASPPLRQRPGVRGFSRVPLHLPAGIKTPAAAPRAPTSPAAARRTPARANPRPARYSPPFRIRSHQPLLRRHLHQCHHPNPRWIDPANAAEALTIARAATAAADASGAYSDARC
jgi:hypothetical protein